MFEGLTNSGGKRSVRGTAFRVTALRQDPASRGFDEADQFAHQPSFTNPRFATHKYRLPFAGCGSVPKGHEFGQLSITANQLSARDVSSVE